MKILFKKIMKLLSDKWLWLVIIVLLGAYFRFENTRARFSFPTDIGGDMEYYQMGEGLLKNGALTDPLTGEFTACRSIMYPAFIAAINIINPASGIDNARIAQAVLGVLAIIIIFFLGVLIHSRVCGLIAAFLFAVNPIMIERVSWMWIESFYYFIALSVIVWTIIWIQKPNARNTILFGLSIGVSLMCRSSFCFLPFFLIGAYYFRPKIFRAIKKNIWLLFLFSYLLLVPWVARNIYHFKEFIPFEKNAAVEDVYAASLGEVVDQLDEPIVQIVKKEKNNRIYQEMMSASIDNILEKPGRYISAYFHRLFFILSELKFLGILGKSSVLFYVFFLWGVFIALKSRKAASLVLLFIYFIGIHIFMATRLRHMFSIIPLFCVVVALGMTSLIQKLSFLRKRKLSNENEIIPGWEIMKKWTCVGSFSLLSLFYLISLFFIAREVWICVIIKPATAFAKPISVFQIENKILKQETHQPIVHFVENYVHQREFVGVSKNNEPDEISANAFVGFQQNKSDVYKLAVSLRTTDKYAEMVLIPSGKFQMGARFWRGKFDEHPRHSVYLDNFFIDKYEVTAANYNKCVIAGKCAKLRMKDGKCNYDNQERANHPANCIDWLQANAYCQWIGKRLPTEAEWEKAARGTRGGKYPWGSERVSCKYAIIANNEEEENLSIWPLRHYSKHQIFRGDGCGEDITWPVGSRPKGASPYGGMDMVGNITEWVSDWYDSEYYKTANLGLPKNPKGPDRGKYRVAKGCSWHNYAGSISASYRFKYLPAYKAEDVGFRCAADNKIVANE